MQTAHQPPDGPFASQPAAEVPRDAARADEPARTRRRVLFHRTWTNPSGGSNGSHLKVHDAFEHFRLSPVFEPRVFFGEGTVWNDHPGNVWLPHRDTREREWRIRDDDVLFLSGRDWRALTPAERADPPVPVLHIAQPRHADPADDRHEFLAHPAIRIVKSSVGKSMIERAGANGPVFLVPDSIDTSLLPAPDPAPDIDVLVVGLKRPDLALSLQRALTVGNPFRPLGLRVEIQIPPKLPTRMDFLRLLNRARIAVFLPLEAERGAEGFYLPALEGMAMGKLVVCPDATGNVDFCIPDVTCLQPDAEEASILEAVRAAVDMPDERRRRMIAAGRGIVARHTIEAERAALLDLLHRADELWRCDDLFRGRGAGRAVRAPVS